MLDKNLGDKLKYDTLTGLQKHLEAGKNSHFSEIYLVSVEEAFDWNQAKKLLTNTFPSGDTLKASEIKPGELVRELLSQSLFSTKDTLLIEEVEKLNKQDIDPLVSCLEKGKKTRLLIFLSRNLKKDHKLYKLAEKYGVVLDIPKEKPWEQEKKRISWLIETALKSNKMLFQDAASQMVQSLGTDKELLFSELEKLITFAGDRKEIKINDVFSLCQAVPIDTVWQLGEALFQRNAKEALRIALGLLKGGIQPAQLLRQIRSQFQTDFQVATLLAQGKAKDAITAEFPYMKGFILDQHIKAASYGLSSFKKGLLTIDQLELDLRNSSINPEFSIEQLILKLSIR